MRLAASALFTLCVSACAEDPRDAAPTCAPRCGDDAVQTYDAQIGAPDAAGDQADASAVVPVAPPALSDAGRARSDAGSARADAGAAVPPTPSDAGRAPADAGSRVPDASFTDAGADAGSGTPEAGASEAGTPDAAAGDAGAECHGPKAQSGEACATDADCAAGLLCDAARRACRPIAGIKLLFSFFPSGRSDGYSEGLDFAHGSLWQSTPDTLWRINVAGREVSASYPTPSEYGEGISWRGNVLYHVSYRDENLYAAELMADRLTFRVLGPLQMTGGCAYGIVEHCGELYTTRCGRSVVDVYASGTTAPILRTFTVSDTRGAPLPEVEDLEIYRGQLWTSTFNNRSYASTLFRVDLTTQRAVAAYEIPCSTLAIDGVAADPETRTLYVTGKDCPIYVYEVE